MRGDAFALDEQAEQQVLGANVVVVHATRLLEGDLDHLLDTRRRDDLLNDDPLVATEHGLDRLADLADFDAEVVEHLRGETFSLAEQSEKQVLGTDVRVMGALRLFLSKAEHLLRSLGEPFEGVQLLVSYLLLVDPPLDGRGSRASLRARRLHYARMRGV
jgi:hypothetical protein